MLLYWLLFAMFATGAALSTGGDPFRSNRPTSMIMVGAVFIILLIGLRY
jgi:hypothetical protein